MSLDHITIRVSDRAASETFYDLVLGTIDHGQSGWDDEYTVCTRASAPPRAS
jgi:catechol 2,3-dioxygenase-like lactoylglutathione lyase family enzyme